MTDTGRGFADLPALLDGLPQQRIVVVGDLMLDRFVYGEVRRISPEAPVPVLKIDHETNMLGGAGNVLSNLQGLDVTPVLIATVGNDPPGRAVRQLIMEKGAGVDGLIETDARPTIIKTRFLASHQQLLRTDYEPSMLVDDTVAGQIIARAREFLPGAGALIISDYGKGLLTPSLIRSLIALACDCKVPVLVDPKGSDYTVYRGADIVTPNRNELSLATHDSATASDEEVVKAARLLMRESGIRSVVATRSQDGMSIVTGDAAPLHLRTEALEVFDVSGAGDTVIATIASILAAGGTLLQAATIANIAGGIVVAKVGTAAIRRSELMEAVLHRDFDMREGDGNRARRDHSAPMIVDRAREARIVRAEEAQEQVRRWQARHLKVGMTNGCFDILHPGHVGYLNRARDKCDRLVVAVNADESVRRLKGPDRPVNDEDARAMVLAALGSVDLVVLFGDNAAEEDKASLLVSRLKPDIYFKGADYSEDRIPEAKIVRAYGGAVFLVPLYEGHSTTATIKRMKQS